MGRLGKFLITGSAFDLRSILIKTWGMLS
jgi:hypothetical protein